MKVRSITIPDLYHFQNLHLDLTYPAGHPKAGQALDKVCIIGQSGTGKTTLLKLISTLSYRKSRYDQIASFNKIRNIDVEFEFDDVTVTKRLKNDKSVDENIVEDWLDYLKGGETLSLNAVKKLWSDFKNRVSPLSIYFPADLVYDLEADSSNIFDYTERKIIDFSVEKAADIWNIILHKIQKYQEEELIIRQQISKVAEKSNSIEEIQQAVKGLEEWRKNAFNPVEDVAQNCLNDLLRHFGLRVKTELDFQKKEDIGFLKVEDFDNNEVPNGLLSTGTKQVMLSALPLYLLKPNNCQILYDEPERSLYPDLQRFIVDYYASLTTNSQFFFSTHSPIIASSFEPWEIVELKFDEKWNVYRDKYYEGENHVDNYFVDPRYLDYDLILKKVFDLKDTSTDLRMEALVELTMLKNQLDQLKKESKLQTQEAKEILARYKSLAQKLAWKTE